LRKPGIYFTVLTVATLLLVTSCSRQASPAKTDDAGAGRGSAGVTLKTPGLTLILPELSINTSEKKRLEQFIVEGIEQPLDSERVTAATIIETARRYLGVPHCMGGTTSKCMDCSGLIFRVFAAHGIELPHSSEEQARYGMIIAERENLQKGDLLFFIRTYNTSRLITHSGIYVGDGRFIHTSSSKGVIITALDDPWWSGRYLYATRILE
jgi:murein DD-endopeptidase / murein LD-carboxypeptidase